MSKRRRFLNFFDSFLEFLTLMVLTFVLSQCSIVKFFSSQSKTRKAIDNVHVISNNIHLPWF